VPRIRDIRSFSSDNSAPILASVGTNAAQN
jgi:hypothetical protein